MPAEVWRHIPPTPVGWSSFQGSIYEKSIDEARLLLKFGRIFSVQQSLSFSKTMHIYTLASKENTSIQLWTSQIQNCFFWIFSVIVDLFLQYWEFHFGQCVYSWLSWNSPASDSSCPTHTRNLIWGLSHANQCSTLELCPWPFFTLYFI